MLLRNERSILGFVLTGLAAAMLTLPAQALAADGHRRDRGDRHEHRDGDRDHRDHDRHYRDGDRDRDHRDRDQRHHASQRRWNGHDARDSGRGHKYGHAKQRHVRKAHKHAHKAHGHKSYSYRDHGHRGHGNYARNPYYCEPCSRRFAGQSHFHRHLSGHHHIAPWRLPSLVVHHTLGWVFFG